MPQLHYIRREPSQGLDPVARTPPQSADHALGARGLPVLGLLLAPKKEGGRHSSFTWKALLHCKRGRNHTGSLHPPQQATNEISFLLAEGEAMKRWGCLEESERLLVYTDPETTNPHLHWGHQHDDAVRERAALAPVTGSKDSRAAGPGWQEERKPVGTSGTGSP